MVDRYDELYRGYRWQVPPRFNMAEACCRRHAADRGRLCLYWEDESGATSAWTYWDIQVQANRLSNALAALGVKRGDRVGIILPQRPETVVAHVACYQMGAVAMPLSILFGPDALEYRLQNSETVAAFVDPDTRALVHQVLADEGHADFVIEKVRAAIAADPRVAGRLALWGRRLVGEALSQAQRVAADRDALTHLLTGTVDRPGMDLAAISRMFSRLVENHTRRMTTLGLQA